jgi:hypothetical protein
MDVLKLAILAFIAGGVLLAVFGVGIVKSVMIAGAATTLVMAIAVWKSRRDGGRKPQDDDTPRGPTIK